MHKEKVLHYGVLTQSLAQCSQKGISCNLLAHMRNNILTRHLRMSASATPMVLINWMLVNLQCSEQNWHWHLPTRQHALFYAHTCASSIKVFTKTHNDGRGHACW